MSDARCSKSRNQSRSAQIDIEKQKNKTEKLREKLEKHKINTKTHVNMKRKPIH